jgi:hypothetical protein
VTVNFIGGGNQSTLRKLPTCCKSLINYWITQCLQRFMYYTRREMKRSSAQILSRLGKFISTYIFIFFYRNELKQPMNIPFHIYVFNNEYILAFFWNYVRSKGYQNHSIFISLFLYMLSLYTLLFSRYNSPKKSVCICTLCRLSNLIYYCMLS